MSVSLRRDNGLLEMRIGIIALLHESNTFLSQPTGLDSFEQNLLLTGEPIRGALASAHHEVGGFFAGLEAEGAEAVPLFAARALPSGTICEEAFAQLVEKMLAMVEGCGELDGLLVAPHGATVSEKFSDADGYWLSRLRDLVGDNPPIIGTLDAHANLSPLIVESCNALVAYRTNPHLDQRARGEEAAKLLVGTICGEVSPTMAAEFPPLAISIERQCTSEAHLRPLYEFADQQLKQPNVLSNSILLGFPYADVGELGSSAIVVTDSDVALAKKFATELAQKMWQMRDGFAGEFTSVSAAVGQCQGSDDRICLLDMGDNVGGGSAADGTELVHALHKAGIGQAFACLYDPESVADCIAAGVGSRLSLSMGGKSDRLHGDPLTAAVTVKSIHSGKFSESQPRHGGITQFDQGKTAICETDSGLTIMLTSLRMVPFSLQQLYSCDLDPQAFHVLVAKGVNAPIAAYEEVCNKFIRVNTIGSTCADMTRLEYNHRRKPMFPWERETAFL